MCYLRQECIPVGCVPAARRPYAGVCFWGGLPGPGGVVCLVPGGSGMPGLGGVVCLVGGGCLPWGGIPACTEAEPPLPVNRMNDRHLYKHYLGHNFVATGKNRNFVQ